MRNVNTSAEVWVLRRFTGYYCCGLGFFFLTGRRWGGCSLLSVCPVTPVLWELLFARLPCSVCREHFGSLPEKIMKTKGRSWDAEPSRHRQAELLCGKGRVVYSTCGHPVSLSPSSSEPPFVLLYCIPPCRYLYGNFWFPLKRNGVVMGSCRMDQELICPNLCSLEPVQNYSRNVLSLKRVYSLRY